MDTKEFLLCLLIALVTFTMLGTCRNEMKLNEMHREMKALRCEHTGVYEYPS